MGLNFENVDFSFPSCHMLPLFLISFFLFGAADSSHNNIKTFKYQLPANFSSYDPKIIRGGESAKPSSYSFRHYHNRDTGTDDNKKKYFINAFSTSEERTYGNSGEGNKEKKSNQGNAKEREQLYEAYNLLHSLAQVASILIFEFVTRIFTYL